MKFYTLILIFVTGFTNVFAQSASIEDRLKSSIRSQFTLGSYDQFDHIMQFNKDTFLIAGYLTDDSDSLKPTNIVFQTFDGGKTWKKIHFKGNAWIYNTYFQNDGKVWMGGSDEYVHYSTDYGTTWTIKQKPFNPINRVLSIYMIHSLHGIAGGRDNGLAITFDNWQTTRQIPSPLDQNKYNVTKDFVDDKINKVQIIDSILLINQNRHIFYTKLNAVEWKTFNIPVSDFAVNKTQQTIELFSVRNKVYVLDAKLSLLSTRYEPEKYTYETQPNEKVDMASFLASNIKSVRIKAVEYVFDKWDRGCMPFALYKEKVKRHEVKNPEVFTTLKNILTTCGSFEKPQAQQFSFSTKDLDNYWQYYNEEKKERQREKLAGRDYTELLNIENDLFENPDKTINNLNQDILDTVFKTYSYPNLYKGNDPSLEIEVINNKDNILKIKSVNPNLFSLPWTIQYKGHSFTTYDPGITKLVKTILPKGFNYHDQLFAGELIYRLIEQRIINEMTYKSN